MRFKNLRFQITTHENVHVRKHPALMTHTTCTPPTILSKRLGALPQNPHELAHPTIPYAVLISSAVCMENHSRLVVEGGGRRGEGWRGEGWGGGPAKNYSRICNFARGFFCWASQGLLARLLGQGSSTSSLGNVCCR